MAITRELAVSTIESILASQYGANQISFRDVMVRNDQVSVTILGAAQEQQSAIEAVLLDSLKEAGATALYCRFRDSGVAATAHQQQESGASKQQSQPKVQGHGANLQSPLLTEQSNVNFIAIASGKGGVGKSTVTVNLATALARSGKRVGIIDADIYGFSVPDMMGIEERPEVINDRVIPIERFGVKVISMGFFVEDNSPIVWRGPMLGKMLRNFFQEIEWGELDYVLLDLPPGTGDVALDVHQMIPQSKEIIVTTPHATASFVAARAGAMAIKTEHEIIGVVENMSYFESKLTGEREYVFGRGGGGKLAETLHCELLAQIPLGQPENHPLDPNFSPSVFAADTPIGELYQELAQKVMKHCE
ncbi:MULTISPECIES: Mrp/NBP35 family ATP-binding protein [Paenibacillus]|uniref:Mrp/NBP35 family ATP-binding protein n=1 Tax=Paenibacillus TaxID=44249 RepID=UPI00255A29AF|nr:Mrp/NBP35 family ATP-binding protein [Paenibacillus camelliae]